jgi:hypothetical protein
MRFAFAGLVFVSVAHAATVVPDLVGFTQNSGTTTLILSATPCGNDLTVCPTSAVWLWRERETYAPDLNSSGGVPVNLYPADPDFVAGTIYGLHNTQTPFTNVTGGVSQGTLINSYLIHARRESGAALKSNFTVHFYFPVLGVIALNTTTGAYRYLTGSDSLGYPGVTTYPLNANDARGLDSDVSDYVSLDSTHKFLTVSVKFQGGGTGVNAYDQIRILTAAPEPAAIALFGTVAAVLLGAVRWRKRRARS